MPRFNATATRRRNQATIERAKIRQADQFRRDYEDLTRTHRQQVERLQRALDDTLRCNAVLGDALDRIEAENAQLRRRYGQVDAMRERGAELLFYFPPGSDPPPEAVETSPRWFTEAVRRPER